ncbi:low temperature requirement protein A [Nocardioides euryhalodurans]|uniref:low temperature requirement protein A n=1 Tax=Nocardioides euryhalodurans TaxID=2518370 RepID=UPI001FCA0F08|nr:low temperature requirement protein A [Nocardioides euryhalodurans]
MSHVVPDLGHRRRRLSGRDPGEAHRSATPLELLYDLVFVVAFGQAANELAHYVAEDHVRTGVLGFAFAVFAISWAWISYSWFASAYDEDDWVCRLATMVQMVGVVILALGLPEVFASFEEGETLDNGVVVAGYVVMRVPMAFQWLRASRHDPERRPAHLTYFWTIIVAQVGWTALVFLSLPIGTTFLCASVLYALELAGPLVAQRLKGGTPWHPHHIAERYGLLVIITLGEGIIGTVATLSAVVHGPEGWSTDAALVLLAGVGLTFGLWWMYFTIPSGHALALRRDRVFFWGYGHIAIFGALAAVGAGLHVAAYYLEHHTEIGAVGTVLSVAVPLAVFVVMLYATWTALLRRRDPFHLALLAGTATVLVLAVVLAQAGVSMAWCLVVLALAPVVTVVGYETVGHRHQEAALTRLKQSL